MEYLWTCGVVLTLDFKAWISPHSKTSGWTYSFTGSNIHYHGRRSWGLGVLTSLKICRMDRSQWRSKVCNAHGPSAVGPKICQTFFQDESPKSAENRFRVNAFLATVDRACTQIRERFPSMNSVSMTFWILFHSILPSASDDCTQQPNH